MVSVIIPTYNREKTIKRAILSVLNQTYSDIEVIVVDDCSSDNTSKIIDEFNDSRLRYYRLDSNKGACYARNFGIKKANGDFIAFQDSDDEWYPLKLEEQLKNINKNNSDLDFCSYKKYEDSKYNVLPENKVRKKIRKYGYNKALTYGNFISTQLLIVKKNCLKNIKFDVKLPRFQDWDLVLRLSQIYKVSFTDKTLVNTYIQTDSITRDNTKLISAIKIMSKKQYNHKNILLSTLYCLLAKNSDKKVKREYYRKSLQNRFNIKVLIKLIINY